MHVLFDSCFLVYRYYELDDTDPEHLNKYLSVLVDKTLREIQESGCISIAEVVTMYPISLSIYIFSSHRQYLCLQWLSANLNLPASILFMLW